MRSKRILFFLCLGSLTSKIFASSNTRQLKSWTNDSLKTFISSKQVNPAERAIEHFLTKLAGPISGPIALRSTSNEKYGLQRTISEVCHVVRRNLMNFAETCGLTSTVHRYKQNSAIRNIKSNDWLPEVLLRGSLLLHDLGGITEEVTSSINRYLYRHNLSLSKNKVSNATENPRFLGTIDDLSEFSDRLCDCTKSKTRNSRNRISILSKALANLAKDSPKHTLRVLGSRLEVALANGSSNSGSSLGQLHVLFCNLVSNSSGRLNRDCITEFKDLSECLFTQKRNSTKRSNNGINNHKDFLRNHWLSGIEDISNCIAVFDDDGNANVKCKTKRRIPKDPTRRIKYVYESLLGKRLSKRSPLHRVASNLGNVLSTMPWGKQLIDETSYYLSIYQDGVKKINRLSKLQKRNEKAAAKYKRVSKSLALYKRGLLLKTLEAIDNIHRTMIEFEKIVVNGIKTAMNENWYGHLRILSCVSDWMTKLFLVYDYEKEKKNETILSTTSQPFLSIESDENSYELSDLLSDEEDDSEYEETALITTKKAMKEAADKSFEKLIRSMNRVNVRTAYEKSILVNLANNLLLTAMFMETIGFISVLFSLGNANKEEMNSFEIRDKRSQKRKRRSLIFEDNPRNRIDLSQNEDISLQMETLRKMMFMYDDKK